jgi:hypothetical protein
MTEQAPHESSMKKAHVRITFLDIAKLFIALCTHDLGNITGVSRKLALHV